MEGPELSHAERQAPVYRATGVLLSLGLGRECTRARGRRLERIPEEVAGFCRRNKIL